MLDIGRERERERDLGSSFMSFVDIYNNSQRMKWELWYDWANEISPQGSMLAFSGSLSLWVLKWSLPLWEPWYEDWDPFEKWEDKY